jgi:hypothetical protein
MNTFIRDVQYDFNGKYVQTLSVLINNSKKHHAYYSFNYDFLDNNDYHQFDICTFETNDEQFLLLDQVTYRVYINKTCYIMGIRRNRVLEGCFINSQTTFINGVNGLLKEFIDYCYINNIVC